MKQKELDNLCALWYTRSMYTITLDDVASYLATLTDDDIIGECADAEQCLLALVLNWLYPEDAPWSVGVERYYDKQQQGHTLSPELRTFLSAFDMCQVPMQDDGSMPVTKAHLKLHLSEGIWHAYKHNLYNDFYAALF